MNDDMLGATLTSATDMHSSGSSRVLAAIGNRMTDKEALQEAERRWGATGYVRDQSGGPNRFKVGTRSLSAIFFVKGAGLSWEEAFLAADRNAQNQP